MLRGYLKKRRTELGLTMLEVANMVGVSEGTVSRWESGDIGNMGRDKISAYAKALKISSAVLLEDEEALSAEELELIEMYRSLPDWMKRLAAENLTALYREKQEFDRMNAEKEA